MQKPLTYALLLATALGLAACGEKSDKKVESATSTAPATQSVGEAAKQATEAAKSAGAAVEQKAAEVLSLIHI